MILLPAHPLLAPLVLLIWAIDAYVVLLVFRFAVGLFAGDHLRYRSSWLEHLTETPVHRMQAWLASWRRRPVPLWMAWSAIIGVGLICRQLIVAALLYGAT